MPAILFGSISTVADTSELQREAFNAAFAEHGLDWHWEQEDYRALLESSGGEQRIADQARERGVDVDAAAVHATKSRLFQERLGAADLQPRAGVAATIREAHDAGLKVGFVTSTSADNVAALLSAVAGAVPASEFDVIVDSSEVERPKPAADAYARALEELGEQPGACVAIEDNLGGVEAARAAGVAVAAFPNENTASHDFGDARVVDHLDLGDLRSLIAA